MARSQQSQALKCPIVSIEMGYGRVEFFPLKYTGQSVLYQQDVHGAYTTKILKFFRCTTEVSLYGGGVRTETQSRRSCQ